MALTIDYYFAPNSPWTYLGHEAGGAEGPGRFQVSRTDAPSRVSVFVLLPAAAPGG